MFDLLGCGSKKGTISGSGSDSSVDHMVDLVTLQGVDLSQTASDLIK